MATTLWHAEVLAVDGPRIELKLIAVHPDSGRFLTTPGFALRLLYEPANDVDAHLNFVPRGPLGELDIDDVHSEDWVAAHAGDYIADVRRELHENHQSQGSDGLDEREARRRVATALVAAGLRPDEPRWPAAFEAQWRHLWQDIDSLPRAHYRIATTSPRWAAHLRVGERWRSAAWD